MDIVSETLGLYNGVSTQDEILRLCQITGLQDLFKDEDFSKSWNVEDSQEDFDFNYFILIDFN